MSKKAFITSVDAFPGAGKTHYFKSTALRCLTEDHPTHVLVYAAPTKILCEEVLASLTASLTKLKRLDLLSRIHTAWMNQDMVAEQSMLKLFSDRSFSSTDIFKVSENLNVFLGTKTFEEAYPKLAKVKDVRKLGPLQVGSIIITTHAAFNCVRNVPTLHKTWVFFDEARSCVGLKDQIVIPKPFAKIFLLLFGAYWLPDKDGKIIRDDNSKLVELRNTPTAEEVRTEIAKERERFLKNGDHQSLEISMDQRSSKGIGYLQKKMAALEPKRTSIHLLTTDEATFLSTAPKSKSSPHTISIYPFHKPTGLFENYDRVTILSAFFADSQMYHSLKETYRVVSLINQNENHRKMFEEHPWLRQAWKDCKSVRGRDSLLKENTWKRLRIVPLLTSPMDYDHEDVVEVPEEASTRELRKFSPSERLTKQTLNNGMLVDRPTLLAVSEMINGEFKLPWDSWKTIEQVWLYWFIMERGVPFNEQEVFDVRMRAAYARAWEARIHRPFKEVLPRLYSLLKPFMFDPKSGEIMFPGWKLARIALRYSKLYGANKPPLMIVNALGGKVVNYMPAKDSRGSENFWQQALVANTTAKLRAKFGTKFEIPKTPKLNGLNKWQDNDHLVHLAAMNPTNENVSLFKKLLPSYDAVSDFLLENLIQTLYRTSLRDPNADESRLVYLYVTHTAVSDLLVKKIKNPLTLSNPLGLNFKTSMEELRFKSDLNRVERNLRISKTKTLHTEPEKKVMGNIMAKIAYYRKIKETKGERTQKQEEAYQALRKQLLSLRTKKG